MPEGAIYTLRIPLVQREGQMPPAHCHRVKTENAINRSDATLVSSLLSAMNALPAFLRVLLAIFALVLCSAAIAQEDLAQGDDNGMFSLKDLNEAIVRNEDKKVFATTLMENLFGDGEDKEIRLISRNIIKDPIDGGASEEELNAVLECLEKAEGDASVFGVELPGVFSEYSNKVMKALKGCEEVIGEAGQSVASELDGVSEEELNAVLECLEKAEGDASIFGVELPAVFREFSDKVTKALKGCEEAGQSVASELDAIVESSFEKKPGSKGLDLDRVSSKYHYDRGLEHVESRNYLKAEASFSKSIVSRENVAALRMRAAMLLKRGEMDAALVDFSKCVELDPGRELHYLTRAVTRQLMGDHKGAIDDYSKAIKIRPDAPRSWGNRGLAWMKVGRNDKAITDLDQSLEIWSEYPEGLYNRGVIRQKLKDYKGAASDYAKALDIRPDWTEVRHNYDLVLAKLSGKKGS